MPHRAPYDPSQDPYADVTLPDDAGTKVDIGAPAGETKDDAALCPPSAVPNVNLCPSDGGTVFITAGMDGKKALPVVEAPKAAELAPDSVKNRRRRLAEAPRDGLGFATGPVPAITEKQFVWMSHRLDLETDAEADMASGIDASERAVWFADTDFAALYETCQENKREATRLLGSALLPKALRTINSLLDSNTVKGQQVGLTMLYRMQGMFVDKVQTTNGDVLADLVSLLRESKAPTIIDVTPRE